MQGVKMRHIGMFLPMVLMVLVVAVSCERNEMDGVVRLSSNKILYNVGWADGSAAAKGSTKLGEVGVSGSSNGGKEFLMAYGEDSLFMYISQEENRSFASVASDMDGQTKASAITSVSSFNVAAFTNAGNAFINKDQITVNSGSGSSNRFWPESDPLNFFAWASSVTPKFAVANEAVTSNLKFSVFPSGETTECSGSFSYELPSPDASAAADAVNQPDLIFAITTNQTKTSNTTAPGTVDMEFHHALSAIHFKVGEMPSGLTVESIRISGVYSAGDCTFGPDKSVNEKPLNLGFVWEASGSTANVYTQNFSQTIADDRTDMGTLDEVNGAVKKEAVFMMIPQTIPADAVLEITFKVKSTDKSGSGYDENSYTLSKKFSEITSGAEWKADKKYVYVISTPAEVDVEIEDQVSGYVKSDLKITNTGLATSYVRAAIVGYWILEREETAGESTVVREDIVAAWNPAPAADGGDGTFDGLPGANWAKGKDGFYYYTKQVEPNTEITDKLFNTYTLTANPPVVGAELRLSILVQSVIADRVSESGWPVTESGGVLSVETSE